ncbi:unnamed protein product [Bursaphelenchus xylophilus]|uniref:(pine wood nematode) hypothetical protein n=1 Tax=Bursaphelenchus xylophilus TaxID=6326 RepID=A0A1I7SAA8_BURXY|nr:unnamed protein product [Bursaphelenchus xylophilus]CAG9084122.1 unnamed protein product [Bursaphelenchus xylophilus]
MDGNRPDLKGSILDSDAENKKNAGNFPPSRNRPLMVDDALQYLEQVRQQFSDNPEVYSNFLEVMKDFKSQDIDTQGVIRRVSQLFVDHPNLITGFNTFLPSGYEVQVHGNMLRIIEPTGVTNLPMGGQSNETGFRNGENQKDVNLANEPNGKLAPLKVNVQDISMNCEDTLDQAVSVLNKIKERYSNQPDVYQQFLVFLTNYQNSIRNDGDDKHDLYNKVVQLFRNDQDLLEEFKTFIPTVFNDSEILEPKTKRIKSENGRKKKHSLAMRHSTQCPLTPKQILFFEKLNRLKIALEKPSILNAFFHSMELYNHNQITRNDVFTVLAPFFRHSPFLLRNLKEIFDQCEAEAKTGNKKVPVDLRLVESKNVDLDYLTTRRMGQSYREQAPEKRDATCSGRKVRHRMVLNDKWMAFASWQSEDSAAVSSKKTPFEETLWRIEDERFDYDICESILQASCGILSVIQSKIAVMEPRERKRFKLDQNYGCDKTPTLIPRCIKRVYGEHASKILSALRNAPEDSVPCVLKRLELTLEQMRKDKIIKGERWAEQTRACLSRSLDSQANFFRNNDTKVLRCRSIIQDIEKVFEERKKLMEEMCTDGGFPPLVTLTYPVDMSVFFDAHYLIECTLLGQHLTSEELSNARFFLKFLLPSLMCLNVLQEEKSGITVDSEATEKFPISYATQLNVPDFARYMQSFVPEGEEQAKEALSTLLKRCFYYGTNNFVLFMRLHNILCERLASIKELCRRKKLEYDHEVSLSKQKEEEYRRNGFNSGDSVGYRLTGPRNPSKFYNDMLDMVKMLMDTNIDQVAYEDVMRSMFGIDAFPLYTMDKLLTGLNKYLINLLQEPTTVVTFNLFKAFIRRRLVTGPDLVAAEESHYEFMSSAALSGGSCIKARTVITDRPIVCFEMVETPNVCDWFNSYSRRICETRARGQTPVAILTYLDEARGIIPRSQERNFLVRNLRRGSTRMHSYPLIGDNIIEEEPSDSRETTPEDDDTDEMEGVEESGKSSGHEGSHDGRAKTEKLERTIPDPSNRVDTSFVVFNDLRLYPVNTSFGFYTTHEGTFNLLLRRGAPFKARQKTISSIQKKHQAFERLLSRNNDRRFPFVNDCTIRSEPHPLIPDLTHNLYTNNK